MNSVISLDGNDIYAVARMFEKMNINELGDITETIPDEIKPIRKTVDWILIFLAPYTIIKFDIPASDIVPAIMPMDIR